VVLAQISATGLFGAMVRRVVECVAIAFCCAEQFYRCILVNGTVDGSRRCRSTGHRTLTEALGACSRLTVYVAACASRSRFGLSALMLFSLVGLPVSALTLVIGHTVVCVPYVVRNTVAALTQLESTLLESSASLGASRAYTFRRIVLPLIRPGVIAGAFIAFMSSFDNVPVSLFLRDAATDMLPSECAGP